jgi:hypothetical protein
VLENRTGRMKRGSLKSRIASIKLHLKDAKYSKKNQKMKPEVNERLSSKNLEDSVLGYSQKAGKDKIYPIGWAASEKNVRAGSEKKGNRWRINFYFQDIQKQYLTAEWEYNKETGQLYPFEFQNAPLFWAKPKRKVRN